MYELYRIHNDGTVFKVREVTTQRAAIRLAMDHGWMISEPDSAPIQDGTHWQDCVCNPANVESDHHPEDAGYTIA